LFPHLGGNPARPDVCCDAEFIKGGRVLPPFPPQRDEILTLTRFFVHAGRSPVEQTPAALAPCFAAGLRLTAGLYGKTAPKHLAQSTPCIL